MTALPTEPQPDKCRTKDLTFYHFHQSKSENSSHSQHYFQVLDFIYCKHKSSSLCCCWPTGRQLSSISCLSEQPEKSLFKTLSGVSVCEHAHGVYVSVLCVYVCMCVHTMCVYCGVCIVHKQRLSVMALNGEEKKRRGEKIAQTLKYLVEFVPN